MKELKVQISLKRKKKANKKLLIHFSKIFKQKANMKKQKKRIKKGKPKINLYKERIIKNLI